MSMQALDVEKAAHGLAQRLIRSVLDAGGNPGNALRVLEATVAECVLRLAKPGLEEDAIEMLASDALARLNDSGALRLKQARRAPVSATVH